MNINFMVAGTPLPPFMPLPKALLRLPVNSRAKVMYACLLDTILTEGMEDRNGVLFICIPIVKLSAALSCSTQTVKRSLNELEGVGLIRRVRQRTGKPNHIYILLPKPEEHSHE